MSYSTIRYSVASGVATVTLDRPDRLNAFNPAMYRELVDVFDETDGDDAVRAVIVTGAGERAFCAGADLSRASGSFDYARRDDVLAETRVGDIYRDTGGILALRIFNSLKPVIAACNGAAVGVGASMQLPMDIRLASSTARFGFVYARRGIAPEAASSWFLPRIVGISTALEWAYRGSLIGADEALSRGLVRSIHPHDELLPAAVEIAREIAENTAPVSIALTRRMMWRMLGTAHPMAAHRADSRAVQSRGQSEDAREGVAAFLEKRPPRFTNRVSADMPDVFAGWDEPSFW
jgi:enoyl-CoA hydratase/carnithine racemase